MTADRLDDLPLIEARLEYVNEHTGTIYHTETIYLWPCASLMPRRGEDGERARPCAARVPGTRRPGGRAIRRTVRAAILAIAIFATIPWWLPVAMDAPVLSLIFNRQGAGQ